MSVRTQTLDQLDTILSTTAGLEDVRLIRSIRAVDTLTAPILQAKTDGYEKLPAAPIRNMQANMTLTLVSPHKDIDRAEDHLDGLLDLLLPQLFTYGMTWQEATQVGYGDTYLAYDIRITSILTSTED